VKGKRLKCGRKGGGWGTEAEYQKGTKLMEARRSRGRGSKKKSVQEKTGPGAKETREGTKAQAKERQGSKLYKLGILRKGVLPALNGAVEKE